MSPLARTPLALVGAGVYPGGSLQMVDLISRRVRPVVGYASLSNRGNLPDEVVAGASPRSALFAVTYLGPEGNVTASLISGTYRTPELVEGDEAVRISARIVPNKRKLAKRRGRRITYLKKTYLSTIQARSDFDASVLDSGVIRVRTR